MSNPTYTEGSPADKALIWLGGEIKSPPFSVRARIVAGVYLRRLQEGGRAGYAALEADALHRAAMS